jgi:hypothetical protein
VYNSFKLQGATGLGKVLLVVGNEPGLLPALLPASLPETSHAGFN